MKNHVRMTPVAHEVFEPGTLAPLLTRLVAAPAPTRVLLVLEGPVRVLAATVRIRSVGGRVRHVQAEGREGARALALAFVAEKGWIERTPDPAPAGGTETLPGVSELAAAARDRAGNFVRLTAGLGGLRGRLRATPILERLIATAPASAAQFARRCDGRRSVVRLLAEASMDELLAARVLRRLVDDGGLVVVDDGVLASDFRRTRGSDGPSRDPEPEQARTFGRPSGRADGRNGLGPTELPVAFLSDAAFRAAYAVDEPSAPRTSAPGGRVGSGHDVGEGGPSAAGVPSVSRPPEAEERLLRDAGVGRFKVWRRVGFAVAVVGALGLGALGVRRLGVHADRSSGRAHHAAPRPPPVAGPERAFRAAWPGKDPGPTSGRPPDGRRATVAPPKAPEDVRRAEALLNAQRYRQAEGLLRSLRATRPDDPSILVLTGQLYVDTGRLGLADEMVSRALELNDRSYRAWVLKGSVKQFQERLREAVQAYRRAVELGPAHGMTPEIRAVIRSLEAARAGQ